jgi:probable HAF family extracellular repeat protein
MSRFRFRLTAAIATIVAFVLLPGFTEHGSRAQSTPGPYALSDLGTLGGLTAQAQDINEAGQIVGYSTNSANRGRAFIWEESDRPTARRNIGICRAGRHMASTRGRRAKPSLGERFSRRLLRLYPREFADEYGDEMAALYRDRAREEAMLPLWLELLVDIARTAPTEQLTMLMQDVRQAFRVLKQTPVVTAAAILTLALGVGGNTAVFSVVHAVILRPLQYPNPDRLIELFESNRAGMTWRVSALNYLSWAERTRSFDALAAFNAGCSCCKDLHRHT